MIHITARIAYKYAVTRKQIKKYKTLAPSNTSILYQLYFVNSICCNTIILYFFKNFGIKIHIH